MLGDRHDARASAIRWVVEQQADVIVRFGWNALRRETVDGEPWSVWDAVRQLPEATPGQWEVQLPATKKEPALRVRIVAIRKSPQAAAQARRKARQAARKHGHTLSAATLEAADYVLILTTLTETAADAAEILALYRSRWQIECAFKRLKSLLHLDALRAFDADLAQTYLLAKLLGAVLVDAIRSPGPAFSPYGYPIRSNIQRRVAYFTDNLGGASGYCSGPPGSRRLGRQRTAVDQSPV